MIGDVDMFGLMTYFVIVSNVHGILIVAKYGRFGKQYLKFSVGVL
jgi:hypothetical protein